MQAALFADQVVIKLIFAALVGAYWIVSLLNKVFAHQRAQAEAAQRAARARPVPQRPDAAAELEQFLNELGFRRTSTEAPQLPTGRPTPHDRKGQQRGAAKTRNRKSESAAGPRPKPAMQTTKVEDRHLKSRIESRQPQAMHSQLETKHLQSQVGQRHLNTELASHESLAIMATSAPHSPLAAMLVDPRSLMTAFVVGEVLGPPLAMRD